MKRSISTIGSLLVAGALLAACGSSKNSAGTITGSAIPKDAAAAALVPTDIAKRGTLLVASDASYAPDEMMATDGTTVVGMDADLSKAIGDVLGLKTTISNAVFDTIIPGLVSGKFDLGASSFTDTKEREKQVDFVTYFTAGEGFYISSASTASFNGLDSLCGHAVAVEKGTTEETDATTQDATCKTAGKPGVTVLSFSNQNDANLAVSSGRAELGFLDSQIAAYVVSQSKGKFKLTGTAFATAPYGLAMAKGGLAPAVQAALKVLIANGEYAKILAAWGLTEGGITDPVINGAQS
jgi:polar amino acid transport system substrate-binding protein